MARPKKGAPPAKEHFVGIRLTEGLYRVIQSEADNAGLSISEYFRRLAIVFLIFFCRTQETVPFM